MAQKPTLGARQLGNGRALLTDEQILRFRTRSLCQADLRLPPRNRAAVTRKLSTRCRFVSFARAAPSCLGVLFWDCWITSVVRSFGPDEARLMEFPYLVRPEGFGTTSRPGVITWKPDSGLLEAETGSDLCGDPGVRHSYRFAVPGFVVIRVEVKPDSCAQGGWTTIWDTPRWSLPAQPSAQ